MGARGHRNVNRDHNNTMLQFPPRRSDAVSDVSSITSSKSKWEACEGTLRCGRVKDSRDGTGADLMAAYPYLVLRRAAGHFWSGHQVREMLGSRHARRGTGMGNMGGQVHDGKRCRRLSRGCSAQRVSNAPCYYALLHRRVRVGNWALAGGEAVSEFQ